MRLCGAVQSVHAKGVDEDGGGGHHCGLEVTSEEPILLGCRDLASI